MAKEFSCRRTTVETQSPQRLRLVICGAVQGVGFRPFVYRMATALGLAGWVQNSSQGVVVEIEGAESAVQQFVKFVKASSPPHAQVHHVSISPLEPTGQTTFHIRESQQTDDTTGVILPDLATCDECLREIFDPCNRRYRYPFTNCTQCGPRYSIIESLPYDRDRTTMRNFRMCRACQAEYEDPSDRRFHAEPIACPRCGPQLTLWDRTGCVVSGGDDALHEAAEWIRKGQIVAVKSIGGFQLLVDAANNQAIERLRQRKAREAKPFALMFPNLAMVELVCEVSSVERDLLWSPAAPIVLLRRREANSVEIARAVAPGNPYYGIMLPYTPLHHLLLADLNFPVVATSGNRSDESLCTDEWEALQRLSHIADGYLVHNRPIAQHADDSVVRLMGGRPMLLRRARGYAPLPVRLDKPFPPILAVGAHQKNTIAVTSGRNIVISPHIGDLQTSETCQTFERVIFHFSRTYHSKPPVIACDMHPDYFSTTYAEKQATTQVRVQHHYAHALACMADNRLAGSALAVAWDGTGYGPDGMIWGGEFLHVTEDGFERVAHLRPFPLPGGEKAVRQPRRSALGLLFELLGDRWHNVPNLATIRAFSQPELEILWTMMRRGIQSPRTTSVGRLFDAVASLVGIRQLCQFEGQAAMELEYACDQAGGEPAWHQERYPFVERQRVIDWEPLVRNIINDVDSGVAVSRIAIRFHNALVDMIVTVARKVKEKCVLLTGGCFQNKLLLERAAGRLLDEGFRPCWHHHIPPNDGGIAVGQVLAAAKAVEV